MKQKATLVLPTLPEGSAFTSARPYVVNKELITDGDYFYYDARVYICGKVDKDFVYAMGQRDKKGFDKNKCYKVVAMPSEINLTVDEIASIVKSGGACFVEVEKQENPMQKPVANENGNSSLWERMYDRYEEGIGYELVKENGKVKITLT